MNLLSWKCSMWCYYTVKLNFTIGSQSQKISHASDVPFTNLLGIHNYTHWKETFYVLKALVLNCLAKNYGNYCTFDTAIVIAM